MAIRDRLDRMQRNIEIKRLHENGMKQTEIAKKYDVSPQRIHSILEEPTADVVEVVRCKDCEHFEAINNDDHGWCKSISDLPCGISVRYDDDFCSYGERAEA